MPSTNPASVAKTLFEQTTDQIDNGHDAFTVVCALAPEHLSNLDDSRADWHYGYNLNPHIRSTALRELNDWTWTELHEFLEEDDHAQVIGYNPENFTEGNDAPSRTSISRAWNDYFPDDLKQIITETVQRIRDYARETGNLLGSQTLQAENAEDASQRTQYRVKQQLVHNITERFRSIFYDKIDINLPDDSPYDKEDLLDLFLHIALTDDFANNGATTWREEVDDEDTAPSGDTLRDRIRIFNELEDREVSQMFSRISQILWALADKHGFTDNFVDAAIDGHAWLYYGDDDTPRISNVDPDRGTDKAYKFVTLSVVGDEGEKFTVAVRPVCSKQEELETVRDLAELADDRVFLRDVFLDRGFYGTLYAQALKDTGVNFVIRAQKGPKSKEMWENADGGVNVEQNVEMSRSYAPYESVTITRFVVPARDDVDDEYVAFITNRELTRWQARRVGASYTKRWGIETSYRVTNDFLPKTASQDYALRVFYYKMAALLYNVWVLVNGVVAESLGLDADAPPPVTAKYLLTVMRRKHRQDAVT